MKSWLVMIALVALGGALTGWLTHVSGQKAERGTQQWDIATDSGPVRVIDTAGVCLYVLQRQYGEGSYAAIAAVPKTQLPNGAGCQ